MREASQPPSAGDLAKRLGIALRSSDAFIKRMSGLGLLVRVGPNRLLLPDQLTQFAATAQRLASTQTDGFSAREFRDAAQVSYNFV